jgi:hypothetical protein
LTGGDTLWFKAAADLYAIDLGTSTIRLAFTGDDFGSIVDESVVDVRADESFVVSRFTYTSGSPRGLIQVTPPGADETTPRTTWADLPFDPRDTFASAPDGTVYQAFGAGIWRLSGPDTRTLIAGIDSLSAATTARVDPAPALGAAMRPLHILVEPDGGLLIGDHRVTQDSLIRRVTVGGEIRTVATGPVRPYAVDSSVVFATTDGVRTWPLDASGAAGPGTRVLGGPETYPTPSPSGTPVEEAILGEVNDLTFRPDGTPVLSTLDHLTTITGPSDAKVVNRLAGGGTETPDRGDGGQATSAFIQPVRVAATSDEVFVLDELSSEQGIPVRGPLLLRRIDSDGSISTIAGGGAADFTEGAAGTSVDLRYGSLLVSEDESTLYLAKRHAQGDLTRVTGSVWALDLATATWSLFAGGGETAPADGDPAIG